MCKALAGRQVVIATKFGLRFDFASGKVPLPLISDSRPESIRRSVDGSLKRLGVDHIDLYFQHRIDPAVSPETVAGVMAELIQAGKITHWGISEANEDYLRRAHQICPVTAVQNRYSMMARHYETLFPTLEELGVGLVAFSPMANGFLTGRYGKWDSFDPKTDYRAAMPQFASEAIDQNQGLLSMLRTMARREKCYPRSDFPGLDAVQEALDRSHSWYPGRWSGCRKMPEPPRFTFPRKRRRRWTRPSTTCKCPRYLVERILSKIIFLVGGIDDEICNVK